MSIRQSRCPESRKIFQSSSRISHWMSQPDLENQNFVSRGILKPVLADIFSIDLVQEIEQISVSASRSDPKICHSA